MIAYLKRPDKLSAFTQVSHSEGNNRNMAAYVSGAGLRTPFPIHRK